MARKRNKEKVSIKERLAYGDVEIPSCVHAQTIRFYMMAVGILLVGIAMAVLAFDLYLTIGIALMAVTAACVGYWRELHISRSGYIEIEGVCKKIEYTLGSQAANMVTGGKTRGTPSRFLIATEEEGVIAILYYKQNQIIDEGDRVKMYFKNNVRFLDIRGARQPDGLLGYELV